MQYDDNDVTMLARAIARELVRELRNAGIALIHQHNAAPVAADDETTYSVGPLTIDLGRHVATLNGVPITLKNREFAVLATLARNPGHTFTRTRILELAYPADAADNVDSDRTIDVQIRRIRNSLGSKHASLVRTVHGVGYKVESTVRS